ncbi:YbjN domain-containing protein [Sanguibacter suaedae]|uniref:YbjN domain-containing protein n=1 Tax=Sanguibacter suaedae TaxID=2795737 RepID=A0A934M7J9_9MICO|nr:YbjN domain-containing protein [Sanguibacter suaedae]MBI9115497.1 YbjN domain-containing protein [Sanguibacter suaedae]
MGFFRDRRRHRPDGPSGAPDRTGRAPGTDGGTDDELRSDVERILARELGASVLTDSATPQAPSPLSTARLVRWITDYGFSYFIDSDGDVGGLWHSRPFYFLLFGSDREILQVRGQWNREITIDRVEEVLEFCNDWNTERIWPKAYFRVRDDGMIQVYGEVAVDFENGADDDQLDQVLSCGLSTGAMLFDALDELYPDPAKVAP